uniref:Vacuolar protein sorting-associated protein 54 N-terminal domain-containing protein n=1 Tax=Timema shepardi TaxID=629360 RepID=A0A7R9G799_TIMSH|nr:unnamed protein product [Timema shepardi]
MSEIRRWLHKPSERGQSCLRELFTRCAENRPLDMSSPGRSKHQVRIHQGKVAPLLDLGRFEVCKHFDADHYSKVHSAYKLLGKMQMAMDQMHMHFASAIHNSAFNVVHGYVELCFVQTHGEDTVVLHKKQFRELCKLANTLVVLISTAEDGEIEV